MASKFKVVVPPGWVRFDLSEPVEDSIARATLQMLSEVPVALRGAMVGRLRSTLADSLRGLASAGVVSALMPLEDPSFSALFPVVTIRPADFTLDGEELDPMDYLVALISTGEVTLVDAPEMVGVRYRSDHDGTLALAQELSTLPEDTRVQMKGREGLGEKRRIVRRLDYTLGVPDSDDRWMSVSAEIAAITSEETEDGLDAATEFLDAWVGAIVWNDEGVDDEQSGK